MKLNKKDISIIIGLILGDGYIDDRGRISVQHGEKQKEYCIYKAKLLHTVCGGREVKVHEYERTRTTLKDGRKWKNDKFITYSFKKQSKDFIPFRHLLYKDGKKRITTDILDQLSPLSIALWWMDDGSLTKKYNKNSDKPNYLLRLYTFLSEDENNLIKNYFIKKYDMVWNVVPATKDNKNQFILQCGQTEGKKFINIIKDIVNNVPGMEYKVALFDTSVKSHE